MSVGCDKKCCANCAHCYETKEGGSYGCTQNVFKPGDLLDDEIHGELQDGDTTCTCWAPDEENEDAPETVHDVFHTPSGLLPLLPPADTPKRDWLDMPGGFRLSSFHVAGRTTFVGVRKNHGDNGGNIYVVEVRHGKDCESAFFKATRNGERLFDGLFYFGRYKAEEQAAVGMLKGYLARIETDRQHNKRNKQNRATRKAAQDPAVRTHHHAAARPTEDDE